MKQRAKQHRAPKPGANRGWHGYLWGRSYSPFGTCHYCKREITFEQVKAGQRSGGSLSARASAQAGRLGTRVHLTAHKSCRYKAILGIKHYRKHL